MLPGLHRRAGTRRAVLLKKTSAQKSSSARKGPPSLHEGRATLVHMGTLGMIAIRIHLTFTTAAPFPHSEGAS